MQAAGVISWTSADTIPTNTPLGHQMFNWKTEDGLHSCFCSEAVIAQAKMELLLSNPGGVETAEWLSWLSAAGESSILRDGSQLAGLPESLGVLFARAAWEHGACFDVAACGLFRR